MTNKLKEYAQLLINVGLNVQKDQYVVISSQVDCAYFARMCIAAAYEAGAKQVHEILEEQKKRGAIIIIACHDKEELEMLSDEIIEISEGRIIEK